MARQRRHRTEGVLDAPAFTTALGLRQVRVDRIHPQPCGAAAPGAEQRVAGAILRVAVRAAELLFDLPVPEAQGRAPGGRPSGDRPLYLAKVLPDVRGPAGRNPLCGLEEGGALLQIRDRRCVLAAGILHVGIRRGHQHRGIHVHAAQGAIRRMLVADQRLHSLRVAAQDRERRMVGGASLRVPPAAVDVYRAPRALHVDQVDAVRAEQGDVDLEDLAALPELEVVDDCEGIRQTVPKVGDSLPLGVVDGLADGDDLGHQPAPCLIESSTRPTALSSSSTDW